MQKRRVLFILTWSLFIIINACQQKKEEKLFKRQIEFLDLCKVKGVLQDGQFVFVPPNNCFSCVRRAMNYLDEATEPVILLSENGVVCPDHPNISTCIAYTNDECAYRGLGLPYSIRVIIQDGKVVFYRPMVY